MLGSPIWFDNRLAVPRPASWKGRDSWAAKETRPMSLLIRTEGTPIWDSYISVHAIGMWRVLLSMWQHIN